MRRLKLAAEASRAISSNSRSTARTITPGPAVVLPIIVCVLPAPVAPYAKTVAGQPRRTPSISGRVVASKTVFWLASGPNTRSYTMCRFFGRRRPICWRLVRPFSSSRGGSKTSMVVSPLP